MSITRPSEQQRRTFVWELLYAAHYYLGGRRGLVLLAVILVAIGMMLNWSWLVAVGIAPFLVAVLPCVAMCVLGLCMSRMGQGACSSDSASQKPTEMARGEGSAAGVAESTIVDVTNPAKDSESDAGAISSETPQPVEQRRKVNV